MDVRSILAGPKWPFYSQICLVVRSNNKSPVVWSVFNGQNRGPYKRAQLSSYCFLYASFGTSPSTTRAELWDSVGSDFFLCPRIDGAGDIRKDERKEGRRRQGGQIGRAAVRGKYYKKGRTWQYFAWHKFLMNSDT